MQYSPKLKTVMEQIKTLLKENGVAGVVVLHKIDGDAGFLPDGSISIDGFSEFLCHINTPYSAATLSDGRFQVRCKTSHYANKDERNVKMASTANMLDHLEDITGKIYEMLVTMNGDLGTLIEKTGDDDEGTITSHTQQNN